MSTDFSTEPIVRLKLDPIPLRQADHDYIVGAFIERKAAAQAAGQHYAITDFVRDALINASHL